jgi:hypothetical protein
MLSVGFRRRKPRQPRLRAPGDWTPTPDEGLNIARLPDVVRRSGCAAAPCNRPYSTDLLPQQRMRPFSDATIGPEYTY